MVKRFSVLLVVFFMIAVYVIPTAAQEATPDPGADVKYTVTRYMIANFPAKMAFAPDGRLFYTEKATGNVRAILADGTSQIAPVIHLDTDALVERGMLGIAFDPNYSENGTIWVVHTATGTTTEWPANQIVRFHEENGVGSNPEVMLSVPITNGELKHNGGNIVFDKDGLLYASFGDYGDESNAQNLDVIPGKIHRFEVTADGLKPAPGNPFPDSSVWAYGLRNTFDFTIDPYSGNIFGSENGLHCDDEINLILPGKNYGWGPDYGENCYGTQPLDIPDYMPPLLSYNPTVAPTGIVVYDSPLVPEWDGDIFYCQWNTGALERVVLNETRDAVVAVYPMDLQGQFCRTDITVGPDGALYFSDPSGIYKLMPDASSE